jgi:DNA repair protein RadC
VFRAAIICSSPAIICTHPHPSGDPAPSREDRDCTARLVQAGAILGVRVLDHIICGQTDYYSFADAGLIT